MDALIVKQTYQKTEEPKGKKKDMEQLRGILDSLFDRRTDYLSSLSEKIQSRLKEED
jgi:hypothetical protein